MRKGKYQKRGIAVKTLVLILTLVLLVGGTVGGTLAWLTASTGPVTNTFTDSDVGVDLTETQREYKMIPGWTIDKDPKAKVTAGSEDSYLFVEVTSVNAEITMNDTYYSLGEYLDYAIDAQWKLVPSQTNVFYIEIDTAEEKDQYFNILGEGKATYFETVEYEWEDDQVLTKPTVTKEMMDALTEENYPKLVFDACAVQLYKNNTEKFSPEEAWAIAKG